MNEMIKVFTKETKIDHMEIDMLVNQLNHPYYMREEAKKESIFTKIINKIKEIIDNIKKKIIEFFSSSKVKEAEKQVNDAIQNDPVLKNQKIEVIDRQKLDDLNSKTMNELKRTKEPEKVMNKYKAQRNAILAATIPITIGAFMMYNKQNTYKKASDEYQKGLQDMQKMLDSTGADLEVANKKIQVYVDFMKTAESDTLNAFKEYLINCSRMSRGAA